MNQGGAPPSPSAPIPIGEVASPPFARLPDPHSLFRERADRFAVLSAGHALGPYLRFLAEIAHVQAALAAELPPPDWPPAEAVERAYGFGMPPLDRNRFAPDAALARSFARLAALLRGAEMPDAARLALARVAAAASDEREAILRSLLEDAIPADAIAEHGFVAAILQVDFARRAAGLDAARLQRVGDGVCPACGAPPVASLIVGWPGACGSRFCACWLCGTLWNEVRIKCSLCGATQGIAYQGVEGDAETVRGETCESCRGYVKLLHQHSDPTLDPVADDVATLGLDLLLKQAGFHRGGFNPFLTGY
jgi:FdhE protein